VLVVVGYSMYVSVLLSTHADRQGMDISVTFCFLCVFCTVASGVKFCMAVRRRPGQGISHFGELCSSEAPKRTNRILA